MEPSVSLASTHARTLPAASPDWAIIVDFDTCIADYSAQSDDVRVSPSARYALLRLFNRLGGAVALTTRASLGEADRLLGLPDIPLLAADGPGLHSRRKTHAAPASGLRSAAGAAAVSPAGAAVRPASAPAIAALLAAAPFAGRRPVILSGDPASQAAFGLARRLGGFGIAVGSAAATPGFSLPDASAARSLLGEWLTGLSAGRELASA